MRNFIVGTSGHIDHGKTTLIKALTGRSTDKLKEEQDRGISINLGFTYFDLPSGSRAGIIDVPGHEKFVKNMLSGVVGMDLVLLIIAADDGVMPQTIEHADILSFMGLKNLIFVVTKCDMVDEEHLEFTKEDIRENFSDTPFKDSKIICVDSLSRRGIDDLIKEIDLQLKKIEEVDEHKSARLNVDRSFSLKGIGTIVTGTLIEGEISKNSDLMLYPAEKEVKVRSIEVHDLPTDTAHKGQRTALNIINLKKEEIKRGDIIAEKGSLSKTKLIDTEIKLTSHLDVKLKHFMRVRLFHGTKEVMARVIPLENPEIKSGEKSLVQFRLEGEIFAKIKDPFVIRTFSHPTTIGGGIILESFTKKHSFSNKSYLEELKSKKLSTKYIVENFIKEHNYIGANFGDIYSYTGMEKDHLLNTINSLIKEGAIIKISNNYIHKDMMYEFKDEIVEILKNFHKEKPYEKGLDKEELRSKLDVDLNPKFLNLILENEIFKKDISLDANILLLKSFKQSLKGKDKEEYENIISIIKKEEPSLLKDSDVKNLFKNKKLYPLLSNDVKFINGFVIRKEYYENIKEEIENYLKENKKITVAEFRDMLSISRKISIAILEHFDEIKFTKRVNDYRIKS